jgi:hypothetical protein
MDHRMRAACSVFASLAHSIARQNSHGYHGWLSLMQINPRRHHLHSLIADIGGIRR